VAVDAGAAADDEGADEPRAAAGAGGVVRRFRLLLANSSIDDKLLTFFLVDSLAGAQIFANKSVVTSVRLKTLAAMRSPHDSVDDRRAYLAELEETRRALRDELYASHSMTSPDVRAVRSADSASATVAAASLASSSATLRRCAIAAQRGEAAIEAARAKLEEVNVDLAATELRIAAATKDVGRTAISLVSNGTCMDVGAEADARLGSFTHAAASLILRSWQEADADADLAKRGAAREGPR
jgi:hypothetical protein